MLDRILGSGLRAKLLGWLFSHHDQRYFVRQLTSLLGEDSTNISRELARLEKSGVLLCTREGRQKYYQANQDCPIFKELRGLALKTFGVADVLRDALTPLSERIRVAFVYGSFARGEENSRSDVDVLVVGAVEFGEVVVALGAAQETIGREVNPTVYPVPEFAAKAAGGHSFIREVMKGSKVFILGDERELARLAGEPVDN
ncbi:MAG: nucleotidyltransferase domain-containing protein [Candidatus Eisenbacteria bacterium]|nr:nucleotidyltransferase domain-containing protein [Candidatus Eisenbacteria bacterium]